jgi:chromosome segregation ATPase
MRTTAQKAQFSAARAALLGQEVDSPPPGPPPLYSATALRRARAAVESITLKFKKYQRSACDKLCARDRALESHKEELQSATHAYTASLQDRLLLQEQSTGLAARVEALDGSLLRTQHALASVLAELVRAQHALKMSESDLALSRGKCTRQDARLKELTAEVRSLRAKVLRAPVGQSGDTKRLTHVFKIKEKREIVLGLKVAVLQLVALSIGTNHVFKVLQIAAGLYKVEIEGSLSPAAGPRQ